MELAHLFSLPCTILEQQFLLWEVPGPSAISYMGRSGTIVATLTMTIIGATSYTSKTRIQANQIDKSVQSKHVAGRGGPKKWKQIVGEGGANENY